MDRTVALREQMNHGAKKRSPFLAVSLCLMVMISVYLTHNGGALYTWRLFSSPANTFTHTNSRSHCGGLPGSKKIFGLAVGRFVVVPPSNARPFLPSGSWLVKLQEQAKQEQAEQELRSPNMTDLHSPTAEIKPSFAALRAGAEASSM